MMDPLFHVSYSPFIFLEDISAHFITKVSAATSKKNDSPSEILSIIALCLDNIQLLQLLLQCRLILSLQIRVSSDMLLVDEDVGDGALVVLFLEVVLDIGSIGNLIQFNSVVFGLHVVQERLGGLAVWAVGLAEHGNDVIGNDAIGFGLSSRHSGWVYSGCGEETA